MSVGVIFIRRAGSNCQHCQRHQLAVRKVDDAHHGALHVGAVLGGREAADEEREKDRFNQPADQGLRNIEVDRLDCLLIAYCRQRGVKVVVRGLRAVSDFEYEFQMAGMNRQLMPEVETVFMTPSDQFQFVSGTFVREIAMLGGDVSKFVAPSVLRRLQERVSNSEDV